ncbi:MAG: hypothetical protein EHM93_15355 [Bacteroidales bacterium]|nr:MAG: hypothetical protein EHM93_15355 [Bacteroidales bacterium]
MAIIDNETACLFSRIQANKLTNGLTLVTVHLVVRDNRNRFFFVENDPPTPNKLNYDVIDYDSIILTNYPKDIKGKKTPELEFWFSTDDVETTYFNDFELFIQFTTEKVHPDMKALIFRGKRHITDGVKLANPLNEVSTDEGIVYFPDVT